MARTVAGKRPQKPQGSLSSQDVMDKLMELGVDGIKAMRLLTIANQFGIKSEVIPGKGIWTIQLTETGYSLINKPVLL